MPDHNDSEKSFYFGEVVGSATSYHQPNCHVVRQIYKRNYKRLRNWQEAVDLGLKPCPHCRPPFISPAKPPDQKPAEDLDISPTRLDDLRRGILRLLDALESQPQVAAESVAARIQRLARSKIIPYPVAACMHTIRAIRNDKEYMATPVTKAETQIVTGALSLIKQWAQETGLALPIELSNFDVSN